MGDVRESGNPSSKSVCVVGAGVSGLRAAGLLASHGFRVTILEARDRIGGRVCQSSDLGSLVDMGASWIHGAEGNPLVPLAEQTDSLTSACGAVYSILDINGYLLDQNLARELYDRVWDLLDQAAALSKQKHEEIESAKTLMDYFRESVSELNVDANHARLMVLIVEMWGAFMGDEGENQSLKNLWLDEGLIGGEFAQSI